MSEHERIDALEARIRALETAIGKHLRDLEVAAYDAWKPVRVFRSEEEARDDDVRKSVLDHILFEARAAFSKDEGAA